MSRDKTLKENGTYNSNHGKVKSRLFADSAFFDAKDLVQVKYEMLREVTRGGKSVTAVVEEYGFSREAYYENKRLFEKEGITGFIPKKPGPKGSHKLSKAEGFIKGYLEKKPEAKAPEIAKELEKETGVKIHTRTMYRYLGKKKRGD